MKLDTHMNFMICGIAYTVKPLLSGPLILYGHLPLPGGHNSVCVHMRSVYYFFSVFTSEANSLVESMATLSIYISRTCVSVPGGPPRNAQMSGRPVKDQRSLKSPRKWLILVQLKTPDFT